MRQQLGMGFALHWSSKKEGCLQPVARARLPSFHCAFAPFQAQPPQACQGAQMTFVERQLCVYHRPAVVGHECQTQTSPVPLSWEAQQNRETAGTHLAMRRTGRRM